MPIAWGDRFAFDTTPLPVTHPRRVRGPDQWWLPGGLVARFGRCAATAWWCDGVRWAVRPPLTGVGPVPVCWALVGAAVHERAVREALLDGMGPLSVRTATGCRGTACRGEWAAQDVALLTPPTKAERTTLPAVPQRFSAAHRNRSAGGGTTAKDQRHREQHRARTGWGLLTRVAGKLAASTIPAVWRRSGREVE